MDAKIIPMIKIAKPKKEITRLDTGRKVVAVYGAASDSEPGMVHIIIKWSNEGTGDITVTCTCKGAAMNGKCWHLEQATAK